MRSAIDFDADDRSIEAAAPQMGNVQLAHAGWCAELDLVFERRADCTRLVRRAHRGPLRVQRPFYPAGDAACHVYLLHPPGGIVGGDELSIQIEAREGSSALVTTPGASKLYRTSGPSSHLRQRLEVQRGATLSWLPQETIAFSGANVSSSTEVVLHAADARYVGWDILCLGRPACDETFSKGRIEQRLSIRREGRLCYWDRAEYEAGDPLLSAAWGLGGMPVIATLIVTPARASWARDLVEMLPEDSGFAATVVGDVLIARYLGASTWQARKTLEAAWFALSSLCADWTAVRPRIWST